jgi:hypothetical protein
MLDKGIEEITVRVCSDKVDEEKVVENSTKKKRGRPKTNKTEHTVSPALSKNEIIEQLTNRKKDTPVLLILGCSDSKSAGGDILQNNYFETDCINIKRQLTLDNYNESIENNPKEFNKKRNRIPVDANYFFNCQNTYIQALERYCTNNGKLYNRELVDLFLQKIAEGKLHILILSGLYGVLKWDDKIIDYHLKYKKRNNQFNDDCISECILDYIVDINIDNRNIYYAISPTGQYLNMLNNNILNIGSNIWISNNDRGQGTNRMLLDDFLPNL